MTRLIVLFVLIGFVPLIHSAMKSVKIVGGHAVSIKEIPYQISLQKSGGHVCGGVLIAKRRVLTAAQCIGWTVTNLKIRTGSTSFGYGGALVQVTKCHKHPKYDPNRFDFGFAILELADYDDTKIVHGIAKLPEQDEDVPDGTEARISGWGWTLNPHESQVNLRAVIVRKANQSKCNEMYRYNITPRMICAGSGYTGGCQADSGGPLTVYGTDKLIGIYSWGNGCATPGYPGVYGRVAAVRQWIREVAGV